VSEALSEQMETGRAAHEVRGTFVKVLTDPVSGKMFVQKFRKSPKYLYYVWDWRNETRKNNTQHCKGWLCSVDLLIKIACFVQR